MSDEKPTAPIDPENPLAALAGETPAAHAAFVAYWQLGDERTLEGVRQRFGYTTARQCETWSARYRWRDRVLAQQGLDARAEAQRLARLRQKRRRELEERDWDDGAALRERVRELLAELPKFLRRSEREIDNGDGSRTRIVTLALNATPRDIAGALTAASQLQRAAVDMQNVIADELEQALDRLRDVLEPEQYARALAALAGADDLGAGE